MRMSRFVPALGNERQLRRIRRSMRIAVPAASALLAQNWCNMEKKTPETKAQPTRQYEFQVGDLAVYPAHGAGRIEAIESRVINDEKHDFYILKRKWLTNVPGVTTGFVKGCCLPVWMSVPQGQGNLER